MPPMTLLTHAVVAVLAFLGGYAAARVERVVQSGKSRHDRWADLGRLAVGLVIVTLVALTQFSVTSTNACYFNYFTLVSASLADRSAATGASAQAQQEFLLAVRAGGDQQGAAIDRYLAALDELEQARLVAPLPGPPECGR